MISFYCTLLTQCPNKVTSEALGVREPTSLSFAGGWGGGVDGEIKHSKFQG